MGRDFVLSVYIPTNRLIVSKTQTDDFRPRDIEEFVYYQEDALDDFLSANNISFDHLVPYATGQKRYLIHTENRHISGTPFFNPLKTGNYYVETHKAKSAALKDICGFLKKAGVDVS